MLELQRVADGPELTLSARDIPVAYWALRNIIDNPDHRELAELSTISGGTRGEIEALAARLEAVLDLK